MTVVAEQPSPPANGLARYYETDTAPTPAQYRAIALAATALLGQPAPESRYDASVLITRLHLALADPQAPAPDLPDVGTF